MLLDELHERLKSLDEQNEQIIYHKLELIKAILKAKHDDPYIASMNLVNTAVMLSLVEGDPYASRELANILNEKADFIKSRIGEETSKHQTNNDITH